MLGTSLARSVAVAEIQHVGIDNVPSVFSLYPGSLVLPYSRCGQGEAGCVQGDWRVRGSEDHDSGREGRAQS